MRGKDLLECMEHIDDALVEEALEPAAFPRRNNIIVKWGMTAACLAVIGISAAAFWSHQNIKEEHIERAGEDTASSLAMDAAGADSSRAEGQPEKSRAEDSAAASDKPAASGGDRSEPDGQITKQSGAVVSEKEDQPAELHTENLTEGISQSVCIDYSIDSYESVQKFGYDLFSQNVYDKNPVLSPVSAYLALAMAGCGADGNTREEFYDVLGNDMMPLADDMMNTLPAEGDLLTLSIADSAWIDDEFTVDDAWLGTIQSLMDAEAFRVNLSAEETMNEINHWIDDKTNGLIDKMLEKPLDEAARLALINTVYFKGKWEIPFESSDTRKEDFYLDKGQDVTEQVDMMNLYLTNLDYVANDFAEGIVLPYRKNGDDSNRGNLAFVALKPTGKSDVREVYSKLTKEVMMEILDNVQTELVNIKLPKFEITFDKTLNESLSNMGLTECFDMERANFDQMGKTQSGDNLYISLVRQKAKIIVDEEGTEAAAVTEAVMECAGAIMEPQEPKEVYFNEPFLYMIMDMEREIPLFIGILDQPVS